MPNRNQIIAITVLGIVTLMLGCKPNATGIGEVAGDPTVKPKPNPVKPKPVRVLTIEEKKIVGTYEHKRGADTFRYVLLKDGQAWLKVWERYRARSSMPTEGNFKWSLVENEMHFKHPNNVVYIYKINPDNSITHIAYIEKDGTRTDLPKEQGATLKKIE